MQGKKWNISIAAVFLFVFLMATPVFAADTEITGLTQTDAGTKTVTLFWNRPGEAVQYEIYSSLYGKDNYVLQKTMYSKRAELTSKVQVSGKDTGKYYDLLVVAFDENGQEIARGMLKRCATVPGAISGIRQQSLYTSRKMKLSWNRQETASGYQTETYLYSAKERKSYHMKSVYGNVFMEQDQLYRVRIRGYVNLKVNGRTKKIYGPYGTTYTALQPRLTFTGMDAHSVEANWRPVAGADSYAVFISTKQKSGYKRVEITRDATAVLENLKPDTRYYVLVRVNKREKGILYRSPSTYVYPVRIDTKGAAGSTNAGFVVETGAAS